MHLCPPEREKSDTDGICRSSCMGRITPGAAGAVLSPEEQPYWGKTQTWLADAFLKSLAPSLNQFGVLLSCPPSL